MQQNNRK